MLAYSGGMESRTLQTHAERFMLAVELSRQRSTLSNEVWGIRIHPASYEFVRLAEDGAWYEVADAPFQFQTIGDDYWLQYRQLGNPASNPRSVRTSEVPNIAIYPSGEVSPFEVSLTHRLTQTARFVISDGIQRTVVAEQPYLALVQANES